MVGQTILHYTIEEKLGEGGMGVVYKAHDHKLDRPVALKFLSRTVSPSDRDRQRFIIEAKAASALNHANICTIFDIQEVDEQLFIVMEYVDGTSLRNRISGAGFEIPEAGAIGIGIAEALMEAHSKGIVHRDIKPENILLTSREQVKVMDFGLARLGGGSGLTRMKDTLGTIGYMSPEQFRGAEVDYRSDLWSLGVVLHEILTGHLPFRGEHDAAMMYGILNTDPEPLQGLRPDAPPYIMTLVSDLLQKDPDKRPGSAAKIVERLQQHPSEHTEREKERSIAVLYFDNLSPDRDSDYFCAGITEDIITDLSQIGGLKVTSRTDVQLFRNKEVNTRQIGETLRVNYVLEGSVRKAGNRIRISAQLIDVRNGFHVWAERFDRVLDDIFELLGC